VDAVLYVTSTERQLPNASEKVLVKISFEKKKFHRSISKISSSPAYHLPQAHLKPRFANGNFNPAASNLLFFQETEQSAFEQTQQIWKARNCLEINLGGKAPLSTGHNDAFVIHCRRHAGGVSAFRGKRERRKERTNLREDKC
jgi:hypothetical protein